MELLALTALLIIKYGLIDGHMFPFIYQRYDYLGKNEMVKSGVHSATTAGIMFFFYPIWFMFLAAILDFLFHQNIDWIRSKDDTVVIEQDLESGYDYARIDDLEKHVVSNMHAILVYVLFYIALMSLASIIK